jgi:hypothetical protein
MRQSNGPNVYMLVVSFAAALLGSADVRAEQPATTQQHWSAEKILPPSPAARRTPRAARTSPHLTAQHSPLPSAYRLNLIKCPPAASRRLGRALRRSLLYNCTLRRG